MIIIINILSVLHFFARIHKKHAYSTNYTNHLCPAFEKEKSTVLAYSTL